MASQLLQNKNELGNAIVYVDYDNIHELLRQYGVNPLLINFFPIIFDRLKDKYDLDIIECIAYANFEKKALQGRHLSALYNLGVTPRHAVGNGKNSSDLMLTVDVLDTLHKHPDIDVFVIVSSGRYMIPLLKTIKRENKSSFILSTKYGYNQIVSKYADLHEYIEDIFNLRSEMLLNGEEQPLIMDEELTDHNIENAKEVSKLLYNSNVWKAHETDGKPVTLKEFLKIISPKIPRDTAQSVRDFQIADYCKYISIYHDRYKGLCLGRGANYMEVWVKEKTDDQDQSSNYG